MVAPNPAGEGVGPAYGGLGTGSPSLPDGAGRASPSAGTAAPSASTSRGVADAAVIGWQAVAEALVLIIGLSSVTVLYRRCLVCVGAERTWLPAATTSELLENDWAVLHASVSRQPPGEGFQACTALFVAFRDLLGSLIGLSLTEQLLPASALPAPRSDE